MARTGRARAIACALLMATASLVPPLNATAADPPTDGHGKPAAARSGLSTQSVIAGADIGEPGNGASGR